jgi:hypothetical protein
MKRKASEFEENDNLQHNPRSATPSLASSSPQSTSTIQSSVGSDAQHPYDFYRIKPVPYWNSRTRKRHRDGRPNEDAIHENTLKKLYDAQRLHLDEAMPMSEVLDFDGNDQQREDEDAEMTDSPPEAELPQKVQRNQRTIEAFFGGRGTTQLQTPESESAGCWNGAGS